MRPLITYILIFLVAFGIGIALGAYLFSDTQPRSFLAFQNCEESCFSKQELLGLLGSVGIQKLSDFIPTVVVETDKTVVIEHPIPQSELHYVVIPKKDMRDAEDVTKEDAPYITDAYAVLSSIIRENRLVNYKIGRAHV